jgi:hypothetical protein
VFPHSQKKDRFRLPVPRSFFSASGSVNLGCGSASKAHKAETLSFFKLLPVLRLLLNLKFQNIEKIRTEMLKFNRQRDRLYKGRGRGEGADNSFP